MIDICTNIKFNIEEIERYGPPKSKKAEEVHHAHLQIEIDKSITLKVYYKEDTYLADKVLRWESKQEETSIGQKIEFVKLNENRLNKIDLSKSKVLKTQMSVGNSLFDPGLGKYFVVTFDRVILEYDNIHPNSENEAYVALGDKIKPVIEQFYSYDIFADSGRNKWKALSRKVKFRKFRDVKYNLKFAFGHEKDKEKDYSIIKKHPQLIFKFGNLQIEEVQNYIDFFILVLSFYNNSNCFPSNYTIYAKEKRFKFFQILKENINHRPYVLIRDFTDRYDVFEFIRRCKLPSNEEIEKLTKIVDRFNLASSVEGEARFMIFYEIFERIKNDFSKKNKEVKTTYDFAFSRKEKNDLIKKLGKEFMEIVPKKQQDEIYNRFFQRVSSIKYLNVKNQYLSLLKSVKINQEYWLPIIKKANDYRDDLFHGGSIDIEDKEFIKCTFDLKKLNIILIGKMVGVTLKLND